ncbi:MAG TPA: hypothetical protein PLO65_15865 [Caulobacter sp.]|nr:hypothetical protein [Caulobacter sp.]
MRANSSGRLWAILTTMTGLATLIISIAFSRLPAVRTARACMTHGDVIRFELARSVESLTAIFGPAAAPCRGLVIAAMDAINHFDIAAFIPTYSAFAVSSAVWLVGRLLTPLTLIAIAAALVAFGADLIETITLLEMTNDLSTADSLALVASAAAWTKFTALTVHALVLSAACLVVTPRRWGLSLLLLAPLVGTSVAISDVARQAHMLSLGLGVAWGALVLTALREALRRRRPA